MRKPAKNKGFIARKLRANGHTVCSMFWRGVIINSTPLGERGRIMRQIELVMISDRWYLKYTVHGLIVKVVPTDYGDHVLYSQVWERVQKSNPGWTVIG